MGDRGEGKGGVVAPLGVIEILIGGVERPLNSLIMILLVLVLILKLVLLLLIVLLKLLEPRTESLIQILFIVLILVLFNNSNFNFFSLILASFPLLKTGNFVRYLVSISSNF